MLLLITHWLDICINGAIIMMVKSMEKVIQKEILLIFKKNGKIQGVIKDVYGSDEVKDKLCIYVGYTGRQVAELLE